jgi:hypothetical protein
MNQFNIETQDHLFNCPHTKNIQYKLIAEMKNAYYERIGQVHYKHLHPRHQPHSFGKMLRIMTNNQNTLDEFLDTPTAQGLITEDEYERLLKAIKNSEKEMTSQMAKEWMLLLLDSWLSAFYKLAWKHRNSLIEFIQPHEEQAHPDLADYYSDSDDSVEDFNPPHENPMTPNRPQKQYPNITPQPFNLEIPIIHTPGNRHLLQNQTYLTPQQF